MSTSAFANMNLDDQFALKMIFCGHFALVSFALFGSSISGALAFYNAFFLLFVLWAHHATEDKSDFPLFYALITDAQAVLFDIVVLSTGYDLLAGVSKFGFAMCLLNLLARFPSAFMLHRIREQRRVVNYGIGGGVGRSPDMAASRMPGYEDLPSTYPPATSSPSRSTAADARPLPP